MGTGFVWRWGGSGQIDGFVAVWLFGCVPGACDSDGSFGMVSGSVVGCVVLCWPGDISCVGVYSV